MNQENRITREDLESKFRALQTDIQGKASDKKQSLAVAGSVALGLVVIISYLIGRRGGRKRGSRMEFRRF